MVSPDCIVEPVTEKDLTAIRALIAASSVVRAGPRPAPLRMMAMMRSISMARPIL